MPFLPPDPYDEEDWIDPTGDLPPLTEEEIDEIEYRYNLGRI